MSLNSLYCEIFDKLNNYMCDHNNEDATLLMLVDTFYELSYGNKTVSSIKIPQPKDINECVEQFISDNLFVTESSKDTMFLDDVYELYREYCSNKQYGNEFNISKTKLRVTMMSVNSSIKYNFAFKILTHVKRP